MNNVVAAAAAAAAAAATAAAAVAAASAATAAVTYVIFDGFLIVPPRDTKDFCLTPASRDTTDFLILKVFTFQNYAEKH